MLTNWKLAAGFTALGATIGFVAASTKANPLQNAAAAAEAIVAEPQKADEARTERPLDMLDWLVGDWTNTDEGRSIDFSCHFTKNNSFLVRSFTIETREKVHMSGMQLIAWDAAKKAIRSWTFDSDGGFGEDVWSQSGNRYTIRTKYTLPDGGTASAVNTLTYIDDDQCTWKSVNREIDGELQPDTDEIVLVRKKDTAELKGGN